MNTLEIVKTISNPRIGAFVIIAKKKKEIENSMKSNRRKKIMNKTHIPFPEQ